MDAAGKDFEYLDSDFEQGDEELEFVACLFFLVFMSKSLRNIKKIWFCSFLISSMLETEADMPLIHNPPGRYLQISPPGRYPPWRQIYPSNRGTYPLFYLEVHISVIN